METTYVERHIKALSVAKACFELGARVKTVCHLTGLNRHELVRLFFIDERSAPRGRPPDSIEWYHHANLIEQVDASLVTALFERVSALGFPPPDALIGAYRLYRERCTSATRISFDRAFDLVSALRGMWLKRTAEFALHDCPVCRSHYLASPGDHSAKLHGCPFCKLVKRYRCDTRIQAAFPIRAIPIVPPEALGLLSAFLYVSDVADDSLLS